MSNAHIFAPGEEFLIGDPHFGETNHILSRAPKSPKSQDILSPYTQPRPDSSMAIEWQAALGEMLLGGDARVQGGMTVEQQTNSLVGWVYVAMRAIRNGVGKVPMKVKKTAKGKDPVEIADMNHPFVNLMTRLNPMDTRSNFWAQTVTFYKLTGNAIWLKVRDKLKRVQELWVMPSQLMEPAFSRDGLLAGYWLFSGDGEPDFIPYADIVHFRNPNPKNRFWGWGDMAAAADAYRAHNQVKSAQMAAFNNDILATLVFTAKEQLQDPTWKRIMSSIKQRYAGAARAGTPLLLEGDMTVNPINRAPAEMLFRDSSELTRDEILGVFGVPPLFAMLVETAYNTTSSQERVFEAYTIAPLLTEIVERINKDLAPEFGEDLIVAFDNPVADDAKLQADIDAKLVTAGIKTPNEARERLGLPAEKWGEAPRWVIEATMRQQQAQQQAAAMQAAGAIPVDAEDPNAQKKLPPPKKGAEGADDVGEKIGEKSKDKKPSPEVTAEDKAGGNKKADATAGDSKDGTGKSSGNKKPARKSGGREYVQAGGPSSKRELGRRSPPFAQRHAETLLIRAIDSDLTKLQRGATPTLREFFAKQARRIQKRLPVVFGKLISDREARSAAFTTLNVRTWLVTAKGETCARLYHDGTTVAEIGGESRGRLGRAVDVGSRCYDCGEVRTILVRALKEEIVDSLEDWEKAADALAERMIPKLAESMREGAEMQAGTLGIEDGTAIDVDFSQPEEWGSTWLKNKDRNYWKGTVNKTTQNLLSERLADAMDAEEVTLDDLSQVVEEVMGSRIQSSAETIARTETAGAYNAGAAVTRKNAGVEKKQWVATLDNRTRDAHAEAHGQVVKEEEPFIVGGEELSEPGDPNGSVSNIVNCRCVAIAVIEYDDGRIDDTGADEFDADRSVGSLEERGVHTISDNEKGNPYHDEKGKFTSKDWVDARPGDKESMSKALNCFSKMGVATVGGTGWWTPDGKEKYCKAINTVGRETARIRREFPGLAEILDKQNVTGLKLENTKYLKPGGEQEDSPGGEMVDGILGETDLVTKQIRLAAENGGVDDDHFQLDGGRIITDRDRKPPEEFHDPETHGDFVALGIAGPNGNVGSDLKTVWRHELAHHVHEALGKDSITGFVEAHRKDAWEFTDKLRSDGTLNEYETWIPGGRLDDPNRWTGADQIFTACHVGTYAASMAQEAFAESLAAYTSPLYGKEYEIYHTGARERLTPNVEKFFENLLKKKTK